MISLFASFYVDPVPERQKELEKCLITNSTISFDRVHLLQGRPTFEEFFNEINKHTGPNDINVIANTDIYFDEDTLCCMQHIEHDECWALTRYEVKEDGSVKFEQSPESQDVWVFRGQVRMPNFCAFPLGIYGCDNRIAYELNAVKYRISNPCKDIKTYHLHTTNVRRQQDIDRLPRPYLSLNHITLDQRFDPRVRKFYPTR